MTGIVVALLAALPATNPLPDGKTIDTLTYTFGGGGLLCAGGSLTIAADGKVRYYFCSAPFTGSGGRVVQKSWEMSKGERKKLFRKLVNGGLLETPGEGNFFNGIRVTSGRWWTHLAADKVPEKAMRHLRPLLAKVDPDRWNKKSVAKPAAAETPKLTLLRYTFTPKADVWEVILLIRRNGEVTYERHTHPTSRVGRKVFVNKNWTIPAKDAAALLDALVADGLFAPAAGKVDPGYYVEAQAGRWTASFQPGKPSEKLMKHFLPLLIKADAEFWK